MRSTLSLAYWTVILFHPVVFASENESPFIFFHQTLSQLNQQVDSCVQEQRQAKSCCEKGLNCLTAGFPLASILSLLTQVKGSAKGLQGQCQALKEITQQGMGLQSLSLGLCSLKKETCETQCDDLNNKIHNIQIQAQEFCTDAVLQAHPPQECDHIQSTIKRISKKTESTLLSCNDLDQAQWGQALQVGALGIAHQISKKCDEATQSASAFVPTEFETEVFRGDCTNPTFFSNPLCLHCKEQPNSKDCLGIITSSLNPNQEIDETINELSSSSLSSSSLSSTFSSSQDSLNDEDLNLNSPIATAALPNSIAKTSASTSGGGLSNSGYAIKALGLSQPNTHSLNKLNTDILTAQKTGAKYNSSSFSQGRGLNPLAPSDSSTLSKFDFKDFLPGGAKYKGRTISSTNSPSSANSQVLSIQNNIFERLSHRFYKLCKQGTFEDCGTTYWESRRKSWKNNEQW